MFSISHCLKKRLAVVLTLLSFALDLWAFNESTQTVTLDGVLYRKGTTTPLTDSNVLLKVQVLNPAGTCVLYEESQTVDTLNSKGYFNIQLGSALGSSKRTVNDPGRTMAQIFQNTMAIVAADLTTGSCIGSSYVPSAGDVRYFRITVTPSTTSVADVLTPDILMDSVPQAIVAQSLQGLERAHVLAVNTAGGVSLNQVNLEALFTGSAFTNLQSILSGNFLRTDSSGATLPSYASTPAGVSIGDMWYDSSTNEIKYQSNTGTQTVGAMGVVSGNSITSGTISGSTAMNTTGNLVTTGNITGSTITGSTVQATNLRIYNGSQYVQLTAGPMSGNYSLSLPTADGISGQVMATNGSGALSWITPSSSSGTISVGQGGTNATSFAANRMIASNGTGSALQAVSCSLNQVLSFDASGNYGCYNLSAIAGSQFISNGGNSTGAAISLGTNDNQPLQIKTNNTVAMTISQNGNVGIGISDPTSKLHIVGAQELAGSFFQSTTFNSVSGSGLWAESSFSGSGSDGVSSGFFMTYGLGSHSGSMSNGNGLIGVRGIYVQSGGASTANAAGVYGSIDLTGATTVTNAYGLYSEFQGSGSPVNGYGLFIANVRGSSNQWGVYQDSATDKNFFAGSVGIGISAPSSTLDISGSFTAQGLSTAPSVSPSRTGRIYFDYATNKFRVSENGGAYVDLVSTGGSVSGAFVDGGNTTAAAAVLGTNSNQALQLETNNNVAMTISQNGNVGIGAAIPSTKLHVQVSSAAVTPEPETSLLIEKSGNTANFIQFGGDTGRPRQGIIFGSSSTNAKSGKIEYDSNLGAFLFDTNATERLRIANTGNVGIGVMSPSSVLDILGSFTAQGLSSAPSNAPSGTGRIYFDSATNKFRVSENGGAYVDLVGGSGFAGTVSVGQGGTNTTSFTANRIIASNGSGSALTSLSCALNQVISFDASGNYACQNISGIFGGLVNGGNATGASISMGTNDAQDFELKSNNQVRLTIKSNGSIRQQTGQFSGPAYNNGSAVSFDFNNGNAQYTSANCQAMTLSNIEDGGSYTIAVKGTVSGTCSFTSPGLTFWYAPAQGATASGSQSTYTFLRMGSDIYVTWISLYQ
jgi:hypothetical protein